MTDLLRVHELGRPDGPTLVVLHGFTDPGLCWPDAVRRWRDDDRIVAPDARGHGESARFDAATSGSNGSEDLVADVVSILEGLTRGASRRATRRRATHSSRPRGSATTTTRPSPGAGSSSPCGPRSSSYRGLCRRPSSTRR